MTRARLGTILLHTFLMLIALTILLPMLYTFLTSLKIFPRHRHRRISL